MTSNFESQLARFRTTHPPRHADFADATWRYIVSGSGADTLLLLPGAPGIAEMAFAYITNFEQHYRVIAPSYPAQVGSLAQLLAGLAELLEAETNGPIHLIGASYSGLVAQYLLHHHHPRIKSLLIGDTGVPRTERARALQLALAPIARLPRLGLHVALFALLATILKGGTPAHRFWQRYFKGIVANFTISEFVNRIQVLIDMDRQGHTIQPFVPWRGPTLLMETADDPLFAANERAALRERYAHAQIHISYNQSHITVLTRAPEYIAVMGEFLGRQR